MQSRTSKDSNRVKKQKLEVSSSNEELDNGKFCLSF